MFPDRLFFLKLFYFYYIRVLFSHWAIVFCSTFSIFFLIFTCTEDGVVEKKKSYLFDCAHYIISEFGNKAS